MSAREERNRSKAAKKVNTRTSTKKKRVSSYKKSIRKAK